jgi:hypothetical protein
MIVGHVSPQANRERKHFIATSIGKNEVRIISQHCFIAEDGFAEF